ncbi:SusC/RagA family TonB-linked outer membrane protein [Alistipes sp.]|uniref:SusC/RagA family TonB-linked outer membrane protein n=1 Tax=Alistipes sp. TaxID=1872444 RepID=UPI003AF125A3
MVRKLVLSLIAAMGLFALAEAQNQQVSGTVSGPDGQPVAGATVMVDGTQVGTTTNADGSFTVSAPGNGSLTVSFIGYQTQTVSIAGKTRVNVSLKEDTQAIDDVIVVAYGTAKKEAFTGSAAIVKSEAIGKRQVTNVTNALTGQVAGVQAVSSNGQPGATSTIKIRGFGSMAAYSDPLYIVDGVPYSGSMNAINTADIESVSVLKDASAAAIYGARGANGVIIITTKRGKTRDARVTFDAKWGSNSRAIPKYNVIEDPGLYYELGYEALYNQYAQAGDDAIAAHSHANAALLSKDNGGVGYQVYRIPAGEYFIGTNGKLNPNAQLGYSDGTYYYTPDDWNDELFGQGNLRQEYNISVAGATERLNYYLSAGYLDDSGLVDGSGFTRYSARLKADYQAKKWLKVGSSMSYTYYDLRNPGSSGSAFYLANMIAPIYPMYARDVEGNIMYDDLGYPVYDAGTNTGQQRDFGGGSNPMMDLKLNKYHAYNDVFTGQWFAEAELYEGLKVKANISADVTNTRSSNLYNAFYGNYKGDEGAVTVEHKRTFGINQQYIATYNHTFAQKHTLDLLAGFEHYSVRWQELSGFNKKLYNPNVGELNNTVYEKPSANSKTDYYKTQGILFRAQYDYDDKYFFSASYRRDASSRFHPDRRWGNFWSVGGAWLLSKEKFLASTSGWLDELKFKISYGVQGNDNLPNDYPYMDQYGVSSVNGSFALGLTYKGNPEITWETSHNFNVGAEFSFFQNRLSGNIEYFNKKTTDLLYNKPTPISVGYDHVPMNVGSIRNSGLEIELQADVLRYKNFVWNVNLNLTHLKNEILSLSSEIPETGLEYSTAIRKVGGTLYDSYLKVYAGVDPDTGVALYYADPDNDDYSTTNYASAKQSDLGTTLPSVYGGFGTSLNFYGVDISLQFSYQLGGKVLDRSYLDLMHFGDNMGNNWHTDILNRWTPDNRDTDVPRLCASDSSYESYSSRFLVNSNYLALNNVTVGYTLPKKWTNKLGIGSVRLYFSADNVAVFSKLDGLDPRRSFGGTSELETANYGALRTLSGGLNITF